MNKRSRWATIALCCLGLALGGCGVMLKSDRPASTLWWLEPLAAGAAEPDPDAPALTLEVSMVPGLDTDRILTLSPDAQLSHLAAARWADNLPDVLTSVLTMSMNATGRFAPVTRGRGSAEGCALQIEVREFFAILDERGEVRSVRMALAGQAGCGPRPGYFSILESAAVHDASLRSIVAAFQRVLDVVTRSLVARVAE